MMRKMLRFGSHAAIAVVLGVLVVAVEGVARHVTPAAASLAAACTSLADQNFLGIPDAPTSVVSTIAVAGSDRQRGYCDVVGVVQPQVQFRLRLPLEDWNGRYFQTGCGGLCGAVHIEACDDTLAIGFAVAAQDMGHVGHYWKDAIWAVDPLLVQDYGRRSTHVTVLAAKAIIARFYGQPARHSYFRGCSTGGREGLSEAQHYPGDFDGIIAGDPAFAGRLGALANNWDAVHLLDAQDWPVFSPAKLRLLARAVMTACDGLDGVVDGIIADPRACHYDPRALVCPADVDGAECLTAVQVKAAQEMYAGAHTTSGVHLAPGGAPYGSELQWDGANVRSIAQTSVEFFSFGAPRPGFRYRDFDFDNDPPKVEKAAAVLDPVAPHTAPDLSGFERRGGKLIVYHGWADAGVTPFGMVDYYAEVAARQGGMERIRLWFRLFMVPGMYHCRGGNAPNTFDLLPALIAWVETGIAPDGIVATRSENGKVVASRPLFAYPRVARYRGTGDVNDAGSWEAAPPPTTYPERAIWLWAPKR